MRAIRDLKLALLGGYLIHLPSWLECSNEPTTPTMNLMVRVGGEYERR